VPGGLKLSRRLSLTAIGYLAKQMTPQTWYRRGMVRKAGGPIVGKRSGVTRDLDRHARADSERLAQPLKPSILLTALEIILEWSQRAIAAAAQP
jgi:hypothetical protein